MSGNESISLEKGIQSSDTVKPVASEEGESVGRFRAFLQKHKAGEFFQKYTMVLALFIVIIVFSGMTDGKIINQQNINNLIMQNAYVFVLATGMLMCILTGGNIDLSVGSVLCFVAAVGCTMMQNGQNAWVTVVVMIAIGLGVGLFQGFWIAKVRVPAFITTLAGMYAFRGLTNVVMNGQRIGISNATYLTFFSGRIPQTNDPISGYIPDFLRGVIPAVDDFFNLGKGNKYMVWLVGDEASSRIEVFNETCMAFGILAALIFIIMRVRKILIQHKLGIKQNVSGQIITMVLITFMILFISFKLALWQGIPWVLIWLCLILGIYAYVTNKTAIGRHLYAVGGNEKATALSGVKTRNVFWFAYANIGFLAGFAGVLVAGRGEGIDPTIGVGYEMDAIASCFIGGASAYGGTGKVSGMIIGALLVGVINLAMGTMGVDANLQRVVKGIVLLVAVLFDVLSKREKQ